MALISPVSINTYNVAQSKQDFKRESRVGLLTHRQKFNYALIANNSVNFGAQQSERAQYPDLKQYNIPEWGEYYCAPVSVANAMAMFSDNGYPNLNQSHNSMKLINELAQDFKTTKRGTTTKNLINGLQSFVQSKGYKANIKYQGFRDIPSNIKSGNVPDLNWIKDEINSGNAVLLNFGVYKKGTRGGKTLYSRQYGHFVTAVGAGTDGLTANPNYLTIHDPYDRVKGNHYIKVKQIPEGKLIHNAGDDEISLTDNAAGFLEIAQRFNYFAPDEVAVINGAISMNVHK